MTAFSRHAESLELDSDRVTLLNGDATNPDDVDRAVAGHDAVVVTLGITENPMRVRLFGAAKTANDVRSAGTRNVIAAMRKHGVRRLVVQSSYGVGETRNSLGWMDRLFFSLLLKPQIADTELQARAAADKVRIEWEVLPHVLDVEEAVAAGAPVCLSDENRSARSGRCPSWPSPYRPHHRVRQQRQEAFQRKSRPRLRA